MVSGAECFCENGLLVIEGRREKIVNPNYRADSKSWRENRPYAEYTAASINSSGLREFLYGRFEIKARIDSSNGLLSLLSGHLVVTENGLLTEKSTSWSFTASTICNILANAAWGTQTRYNVNGIR